MLSRLDGILVGAGIALLRLYRVAVGRLLPGLCRFEPSCSRYAEQALRRYGFGRGSLRAVARLLRCHPFHAGGLDPLR